MASSEGEQWARWRQSERGTAVVFTQRGDTEGVGRDAFSLIMNIGAKGRRGVWDLPVS